MTIERDNLEIVSNNNGVAMQIIFGQINPHDDPGSTRFIGYYAETLVGFEF